MAIFQNDFYSVEKEEFPGCLVSAKVTISPVEVNNIYKEALKKLKKSISIPGFRKGKVSEGIIIDRYNEDLQKNWREALLHNALRNALSLTKINPLNQQSIRKIDFISCELDNSSTVLIEFERYPEIPSINWENLSCSLENHCEVSEKDISENLENIRYYFATTTSLEREARKDDFILLSLKISENGNHERFLFEKKRFKLSEEDMNEKLLKKFLGLKKGDTLTEKITHKEIAASLQGDTLTFLLDDVMSLELPQMDDEKAKQLKADSLDDLKAKLKIQLKNRVRNKIDEENLVKLEEALNNLVNFELPLSLINNKLSVLKQNKLLSLRLVDYLEDQEILEREDLINQESLEEAKKQLKITFLVRKIFEQEGLSYSKEELNSVLEICSKEKFLANPSQPPEITQHLLDELVLTAKERLVYQKALELAKTKASIKE